MSKRRREERKGGGRNNKPCAIAAKLSESLWGHVFGYFPVIADWRSTCEPWLNGILLNRTFKDILCRLLTKADRLLQERDILNFEHKAFVRLLRTVFVANPDFILGEVKTLYFRPAFPAPIDGFPMKNIPNATCFHWHYHGSGYLEPRLPPCVNLVKQRKCRDPKQKGLILEMDMRRDREELKYLLAHIDEWAKLIGAFLPDEEISIMIRTARDHYCYWVFIESLYRKVKQTNYVEFHVNWQGPGIMCTIKHSIQGQCSNIFHRHPWNPTPASLIRSLGELLLPNVYDDPMPVLLPLAKLL